MKQGVVTAMLCLLAAPARADIIVDHQPHPYGGPASDTSFTDPFGRPAWQRVADNFMLNNPDEAVALAFWGFYNADNPPATETMRIRILGARASDTLPDEDNVLSETTVQNPSRVATGRIILTGIGPHEYRYQASLAMPITLDANRKYWLEVAQIGDITRYFRWETSVTDNDGDAFINDLVSNWQYTPNQGDEAFQLISPEPVSTATLGLGLLCLARRHRSRKEARELN